MKCRSYIIILLNFNLNTTVEKVGFQTVLRSLLLLKVKKKCVSDERQFLYDNDKLKEYIILSNYILIANIVKICD